MLMMPNDRKLRSWPFYALALLGVATGIPMLVTGLETRPPPTELLEKVSGRVISLSWISDPEEGSGSSMTFTLEGSERVFLLAPMDPEPRAYERLIGIQVDVWVDGSPGTEHGPEVVYQLKSGIGGQEAVEPPIISYDHKSKTDSMASRVRWGAVLVVVAAVFVVLGRLVDVWNRHCHEIMGS